MNELWEALARLLGRLEPLEKALHLPPLEIPRSGDTAAFWTALKGIEDRIILLENPVASETPNEEVPSAPEESVVTTEEHSE